jgi:hypothetical protein
MRFARLKHRLKPYYTFSFHFCFFNIYIGNIPMSAQELNGEVAPVLDGNAVCKHMMPRLVVRPWVLIGRFNGNPDIVGYSSWHVVITIRSKKMFARFPNAKRNPFVIFYLNPSGFLNAKTLSVECRRRKGRYFKT